MNIHKKKIVIIGGGVTGLTTAFILNKACGQEYSITLVSLEDPTETINRSKFSKISFCSSPSFAGPLGLEPQSAQIWNGPGTEIRIKEGLKNQLSTLAVSNNLSPDSEKWLKTFAYWDWNHKDIVSRTENLYVFNTLAINEFKNTFSSDAAKIGMALNGNLRIYINQKEYNDVKIHVDLVNKHGGKAKLINKDDCLKFNKELKNYLINKSIAGAAYYPMDGRIDGLKHVQYLADKLKTIRGLKLIYKEKMKSIRKVKTGDFVLTLSNGKEIKADYVITANGFGSKELLKPLGIELPVHKLWGWSCVIPKIKRIKTYNPMTIGFNSECFIVSEFDSYLKVGGLTEIINEDVEKPNFERVEKLMLKNIRIVFPNNLNFHLAQYFAGARCMTFDDLPVIGPVGGINNLLLAVPTGHLGFLQSVAIGKIIENIILKKPQPISLNPYSLERFNNDFLDLL